MTIGLALAGIAAIALAAHPRGARSLVGLMGTPEEHLAKFREYISMAENENLPIRFRFSLVERAWAEAEWTNVPVGEQARARELQSKIEDKIYETTRLPDVPMVPMRANLVSRKPQKSPDPRHPPAGWKYRHTYKGMPWLVFSEGDGMYTMRSASGAVHTGTGNTVLSKIHGHNMDVYNTFKLGKPGARFNPQSPPPGWFL
jgi:hypothetical protein